MIPDDPGQSRQSWLVLVTTTVVMYNCAYGRLALLTAELHGYSHFLDIDTVVGGSTENRDRQVGRRFNCLHSAPRGRGAPFQFQSEARTVSVTKWTNLLTTSRLIVPPEYAGSPQGCMFRRGTLGRISAATPPGQPRKILQPLPCSYCSRDQLRR